MMNLFLNQCFHFEFGGNVLMNSAYTKRLVYLGFCDHDCEAYYECPHCGKGYRSWGLFHKGIREGDKFKCIKCGNIIQY